MKQGKIYIIEDDETIVKLLKQHLSQTYEVFSVQNFRAIKQEVGNRYLLTVNEQETYMVPKHVYDATKIGDNVPSYLNGK